MEVSKKYRMVRILLMAVVLTAGSGLVTRVLLHSLGNLAEAVGTSVGLTPADTEQVVLALAALKSAKIRNRIRFILPVMMRAAWLRSIWKTAERETMITARPEQSGWMQETRCPADRSGLCGNVRAFCGPDQGRTGGTQRAEELCVGQCVCNAFPCYAGYAGNVGTFGDRR